MSPTSASTIETMASKQRVSSCGQWIYLENGARFRRTILKSVAEPKRDAESENLIAELDEDQQS